MEWGSRGDSRGDFWELGGGEAHRGLQGQCGQAGGRSAHLQADGAGQQDAESQRELFESVAEREAGLADVHSLHHAGVAQLPQAQLPVEELRAQRQG